MKIRNGFVSNSSSSSFTCNVCSNTESGYDASLSDFEMGECEAGHIFCNHHRDEMFKNNPALAEEYEKWQEGDCDNYEIPSKFCPICTMTELDSDDVMRYVLLCSERTFESFTKEIREKFAGDYNAFSEAIKGTSTSR